MLTETLHDSLVPEILVAQLRLRPVINCPSRRSRSPPSPHPPPCSPEHCTHLWTSLHQFLCRIRSHLLPRWRCIMYTTNFSPPRSRHRTPTSPRLRRFYRHLRFTLRYPRRASRGWSYSRVCLLENRVLRCYRTSGVHVCDALPADARLSCPKYGIDLWRYLVDDGEICCDGACIGSSVLGEPCFYGLLHKLLGK